VCGCADKIVQIPRVVDLWRERKELEDRRLLGQELLESAARFRATSANTDSGPRIVQVLEFSRSRVEQCFKLLLGATCT
jgi:hypothetical protein